MEKKKGKKTVTVKPTDTLRAPSTLDEFVEGQLEGCRRGYKDGKGNIGALKEALYYWANLIGPYTIGYQRLRITS